MDLNYFKDQIHEELEGAKSYIEKAIEAKISHPTWSRTFAAMADAEAEHAANLMRMMETCIRETKGKESVHGKTAEMPISSSTSALSSSAVTSMSSSHMSPEEIYKDCMKSFGEVMTYVNNMKRGL